jgi:hypothetical protein
MKTANKNEKKTILDSLIELFEQNRRWLLFFGTGTSCALDTDFGMPALQKHLGKALAAEPEWARVDAALKDGKTLEQALDGTGAGLSPATKAKFRKVTGDHVASIDRRFRDRLLTSQAQWVGSRLLKALAGRLPARNPKLSVITSNYDMLIEYACSAHGLRWTTGFVGGLTRTWNWEASQDSLLQSRVDRNGVRGARGALVSNRLPRVELLKVHGSINRFTMGGIQIECDLWTEGSPEGVERAVAVPGGQKYEQVAVNNMGTMARAEHAQDEAQAFAVIGYGFNDTYLHQKMLALVRGQNRPLVVLTQNLSSDMIADLRKHDARVWVLVAPRIADGKNDESKTMVTIPGQADPFVLDDEQLWSCDAFAEKILGA